MDFPVYRKYVNLDAYFIITSSTTWIEYKRLGKKYLKFEFTAHQFPEKLFIQDLITLTQGIAEATKEEIETLVI